MSVDKNTAEPTVDAIQEASEKTEQPETTETPETTVETSEKPLGELLQDEPERKSEKPTVDFKELYKKERKDRRQLEAKLKEFEESIEDGASDDDIKSDIDDLADEFNVDKKFLKKLEKTIKANLESQFDEKVSSKLKPIEEKEKAERFNQVFNTYFDNALDRAPEFKGIVNKDVIRTLALQPQNANKTVTQLIEETYGSALGGRRTIETTTPRGGAAPTEVDFDRAKSDTAYFREVMADPELKKKYNDGLAKRILR